MSLELPNLLLIGAAKSGTTSLADLLNQHSDIFVPKEKEVHFFDSSHNYSKGKAFYKSFFLTKYKYKYKCDATPAYLASHKTVIPRLNTTIKNKDMKFIIILRNPVDRAWSHYNHIVRARGEDVGFMDSMTGGYRQQIFHNPELWKNYYNDGLYDEQIKAWFSAFDQKNFHILFFEDFINNTETEMKNIFNFLNIPEQKSHFRTKYKNQMSAPRSLIVRNTLNSQGLLRSFIRIAIPNKKLRHLLISYSRKINNKKISQGGKPKIKDIDRKTLSNYYLSSVQNLKVLLKHDLPFWSDF